LVAPKSVLPLHQRQREDFYPTMFHDVFSLQKLEYN